MRARVAVFLLFALPFAAVAAFCFLSGLSNYETGQPFDSMQDLASFHQAIWNTAHGNPFRVSILYDGVRDHFEPIILFYSFVYRLQGDFHVLLALHSLLAASGTLIFSLMAARHGLSVPERLLLPLLFALSPWFLAGLHKDYFRADILFFSASTALVYAAHYRVRPIWLWAAVLGVLLCKESGAFLVIGLGLYWLSQRQFKRAMAAILIGVTWFGGVHFWLLPSMAHDSLARHSGFVHKSIAPIVERLSGFEIPLLVAMATVLLLALRRYYVLVVVPQYAFAVIYRGLVRYFYAPFAVITLAAAHILVEIRSPRVRQGLLAVALLACVASHSWGALSLRPSGNIANALELGRFIPAGAALCTEPPALMHFANRRELYVFNRKHYYTQQHACMQAEYFLLKRKDFTEVKSAHRARSDRQMALEEVQSLPADEVAHNEDWVLFKRGKYP